MIYVRESERDLSGILNKEADRTILTLILACNTVWFEWGESKRDLSDIVRRSRYDSFTFTRGREYTHNLKLANCQDGFSFIIYLYKV